MSRKTVCLLGMILVATALCAGGAAHYPLISHADLPLYPPIAWALTLTGIVDIHIIVTKGSVVDAHVESVVIKHCGACRGPLNEKGRKNVSFMLSTPSLANVKTWHFRSDWSGTLSVTYVYRIQGKETTLPENPTVQFDLPVVTVTARPFKPTVQYGEMLDAAPRFLYASLEFGSVGWKDIRIRAMRSYRNFFAFTYRFPWWGKRPGETRADKTSK